MSNAVTRIYVAFVRCAWCNAPTPAPTPLPPSLTPSEAAGVGVGVTLAVVGVAGAAGLVMLRRRMADRALGQDNNGGDTLSSSLIDGDNQQQPTDSMKSTSNVETL